MKVRAMVTVKGIVQGVNFRYYTMQSAIRLHVSGWVRNLPNGDVEGCFEGEEPDVRSLVEWCRKGPASARVEKVLTAMEAFRGEFDRFDILR